MSPPTCARVARFIKLIASILALAFLCTNALAAKAPSPTAQAARDLLESQRDAWNRGDIDAFMRGYWKNDDLRFASGGDIQRGFATTLDRYRKTYPDRGAMGTLEFELVEVRALGPEAVYVFGRWRLARTQDAPGAGPRGLFTLIVERKDGRWVITRDHTSAAER
jgi:uncharacterized protein (TIGR02246 family)